MGHWKELGEVPDSEDEALESQESGGSTAYDAECNAIVGSTVESPIGIDISSPVRDDQQNELGPPFSSAGEAQHASTPPKLRSPQQASLNLEDDMNDEIDLVCDVLQEPHIGENGYVCGPITPVKLPHPEISQHSQPERPQQLADDPAGNTPCSSQSMLSCLSRSPSLPSDGYMTEPHRERDNRPLLEISDSYLDLHHGLLRSLRPRKPIQQHPYLIENAHYTNIMKSHGVRPVRNVLADQPIPTGSNEDSQENDFAESTLYDEADHHVPTLLGDGQLYVPSRHSSMPIDTESFSLSPKTPALAHRYGGTRNSDLPEDDDFPSPTTFRLRHWQPLSATSNGDPPAAQTYRTKQSRQIRPTVDESAPPAKWKPVRIDISPISLSTASAQHPEHQQTSSPISGQDSFSMSSQDSQAASTLDIDEYVRPAAFEGPDFSSDATDASQSDSAIIRKNVKRIKGVLPASWLLLDKQNAGTPPMKIARNGAAAGQGPRKGVALLKHQTYRAPMSTPNFLFGEFGEPDNEGIISEQADVLATSPITETLPADALSEMSIDGGIDGSSGEDRSVVEYDAIDRMDSGFRRNGIHNGAKRQKTRHIPPLEVVSGRKMRQPPITKLLSRPRVSVSGMEYRRQYRPLVTRKDGQHRRYSIKRTYPSSPQRFSILDFIEPRAPNFIRIAARTARSRSGLGTASPSHKLINLGNRHDNVDALPVLRDWKAGKLKPRSQSASIKTRGARGLPTLPALREISPNLERARFFQRVHSSAALCTSAPSPLDTARLDSPADVAAGLGAAFSASRVQHRPPTSNTSRFRITSKMMRPAQLEAPAYEQSEKASFVTKKMTLDATYRRRTKQGPVLPNVSLERFIDGQALAGESENAGIMVIAERHLDCEQAAQDVGRSNPSKRSRFRKRFEPKRIDVTAPHFTHALDPLSDDLDTPADTLGLSRSGSEDGKLHGLGPFGSVYTQHFDIFPLDSGLFFHRSTLIGSGRLASAINAGCPEKTRGDSVISAIFQLDEKLLRWNVWNDDVSSEFGILLDWIADSFVSKAEAHTGMKLMLAFDFAFDFIQNVIASPVVGSGTQRAFVLRSLEAVSAFVDRLEAYWLQVDESSSANAVITSYVSILTRTLLLVVWDLQICRTSPQNILECFRVEETLQRVARLLIESLVRFGIHNIRAAYDVLRQPSVRDLGIRNDMPFIMSWVILIQVLEYAKLPRAGFWDMTYSVMLTGVSFRGCIDARELERSWKDMFTLLPLTEFDNKGVIQPGLRHLVPLDGWALPRQALDCVFRLYKANSHQSPSFNAYCRAIVGRCHYLVQEWGWRRCSSIIGVIFDFYGSQDFAHLRNEEVYRSPAFLEELACTPSLGIDADDKCFHIFVKMLSQVILHLRRLGLTNEMKNLIARTLPNHNRQYLKEKDIHQRDLAALRNHHDLLCALFWAAPVDFRPGVHLIEKLVVPATSHKEACLINIRAWNQLARFVVASEEDISSYRVFSSWMTSIFQQLLHQYLSADADIQKQFANLSRAMMKGFSPEYLRAMVSKNKAAAKDVLHACVVACLDVLKHAKSLGAATACFSMIQLEPIFMRLGLASSSSDWRILHTVLDFVEFYIDRLERAMDEQYSVSSNPTDPQQTEEAILMLDHKFAKSFFSFSSVVTHMSWDDKPPAIQRDRVACIEKCVVLSARLASRFIHSGVYRISKFFGVGDYCLFRGLPDSPSHGQRKFLSLFVSSLIQNSVFDFKDIGTNVLELWLLAIVKPRHLLAYEIQLAKTLKQHGLPYLTKAFVPTNGQAPSYSTNRAFFACAVSSMRQSLRDVTGSRRQIARDEFARGLNRVMQQMKEELKCTRTASTVHSEYVDFVRSIVALMKSHGGDICPLDQFYYQQSPDYSPAVEDPQLQTAGIVAYGLRLGEGEATAAPQLFYYLHNNFNIAFVNDQLGQQCKIIEHSLENSDVVRFMVQRMLPAVIRATSEVGEAWPMLDLYCVALGNFLKRSCVPSDVGDENLAAASELIQTVLAWLRSAGVTNGKNGGRVRALSRAHLHIATQLSSLVSSLQPFLMAYACLPTSMDTNAGLRFERALNEYSVFARTILAELETQHKNGGEMAECRDEVLGQREGFDAGVLHRQAAVDTSQNENGWNRTGAPDSDLRDRAQEELFSKTIVRHVQDNWPIVDECIIVRKASGQSAASATGSEKRSDEGPATISYSPRTRNAAEDELRRQLCMWKLSGPVTACKRYTHCKSVSAHSKQLVGEKRAYSGPRPF